ncbi:hypothetical protein TRFO_12071 [Tritrichomonas foetus]|uniref:Initiator binding domain-containing protein n=1 Tax=Tritrichomonas foetus TaxID=1144522 RepID=A0A1J4J0W8_9EUKA|nr:hypothetical protein TRFO_12071 [Tritrichomonas foetus]|eukprot:OHS93058.1 hypothetical protein TRFO_12071 [Tritrichomonas foetus]
MDLMNGGDEMKVPRNHWNQLTSEDQATFKQLHIHFLQQQKEHIKERKTSFFFNDVLMLMKYIDYTALRRDDRAICTGLAFSGPFACVNTQQLKIILGRCKSSINNSFQQIGYDAVKNKSKSREAVLAIIPSLITEQNTLRKWTVRCVSENATCCFLSYYRAPQLPFITDEDLYDEKKSVQGSMLHFCQLQSHNQQNFHQNDQPNIHSNITSNLTSSMMNSNMTHNLSSNLQQPNIQQNPSMPQTSMNQMSMLPPMNFMPPMNIPSMQQQIPQMPIQQPQMTILPPMNFAVTQQQQNQFPHTTMNNSMINSMNNQINNPMNNQIDNPMINSMNNQMNNPMNNLMNNQMNDKMNQTTSQQAESHSPMTVLPPMNLEKPPHPQHKQLFNQESIVTSPKSSFFSNPQNMQIQSNAPSVQKRKNQFYDLSFFSEDEMPIPDITPSFSTNYLAEMDDNDDFNIDNDDPFFNPFTRSAGNNNITRSQSAYISFGEY